MNAADVDAAARDVLKMRGFGPQFKHSTGHGVGFSAIDANAKPRLHPKSEDTLEAGMVFNVEPAIYFEGYGGMRHCDMVAVTDSGAEVLTPFQSSTGQSGRRWFIEGVAWRIFAGITAHSARQETNLGRRGPIKKASALRVGRAGRMVIRSLRALMARYFHISPRRVTDGRWNSLFFGLTASSGKAETIRWK